MYPKHTSTVTGLPDWRAQALADAAASATDDLKQTSNASKMSQLTLRSRFAVNATPSTARPNTAPAHGGLLQSHSLRPPKLSTASVAEVSNAKCAQPRAHHTGAPPCLSLPQRPQKRHRKRPHDRVQVLLTPGLTHPTLPALLVCASRASVATYPSMFGSQANSMRPSPAGTIFDKPSTRTKKIVRKIGELPKQQGPGPFEPGIRLEACGTQHLSYRTTYPRSLLPKDERFAHIERFQKAVATPGPGAYNPC